MRDLFGNTVLCTRCPVTLGIVTYADDAVSRNFLYASDVVEDVLMFSALSIYNIFKFSYGNALGNYENPLDLL